MAFSSSLSSCTSRRRPHLVSFLLSSGWFRWLRRHGIIVNGITEAGQVIFGRMIQLSVCFSFCECYREVSYVNVREKRKSEYEKGGVMTVTGGLLRCQC